LGYCEPSRTLRDLKGIRQSVLPMFSQMIDRSPLRIEAQSMPLAPPEGYAFGAWHVWRVVRALGGRKSQSAGADLAAFIRFERCWIDGTLPVEPLRVNAAPPLLF
jgi:hypothetical protein